MTNPDSESKGTRDHILDVATRLFARLGYDGSTAQMIASAAGYAPATVTEQVGGKRELYLAVMERLTNAEYAYLQEAAAEFTPGLPGLIRLTDAYLDFCLEHPEVPALWAHRWLMDAADIAELEERFSGVIQSLLLREIRKIVGGGEVYEGELPFDLEVAAWGSVWCIHGFILSGFVDEEGRPRSPQDPEAQRRVRAYLHQIVERVTGGQDPAASPPGRSGRRQDAR